MMFDLPKECYHIFDNIDGFFVIDTDERIVFMADNLIKQMHRTGLDDVKGKSVRDLMPHNNAYKILKTGEKQIAEMYFVEGYTIVSNG